MLQVEASDLPLQRAYRWEQEIGDRTYMIQPYDGGRTIEYSWKETLRHARIMANYIGSLNLPAGSNIAILSKNCAHFIMSELAIWMAGHATVAIYPTLNAETVEYVLRHSEAKLLFVGKLDVWNEMKAGVPEELPCVAYPLAPETDYTKWDDIIASTEPIAGSPVREMDDAAMIVYTSGSTGQPKGVVHSFGNLARAARGFQEVMSFTPEERVLSYLPLAHVFERAAVEMASLYNGFYVYFAESLDTFIEDIQRARPTLFQSVPRLWLKFQQGVFRKMPPKKLDRLLRIPILNRIVRRKVLEGLGLDQCRMAVSGSAPIPPELIRWYRRLGLELLEGYGMSENFAYSHFSRPGRGRIGYVGEPNPGVAHRISEEGEIQVRSPADMVGYYKMPEETRAAFTEDGYLKTGDRGEIDDMGRLKITGRVKELFKTSKGKYVAPAPIENLLNASPFVEQSFVTGSGREAACACVMLSEELRARRDDPALQEELGPRLKELLFEVNGKVEPHERLAFLVVVRDEWLIENDFLTPTMKIKRSVLEDVYGAKLEEWYGSGQKVIWE